MSGVSAPATPERFAPSLTGLLAQTCDTADANGTFQPTTNDAIGIKCPIPSPITVSNVWISVATAGIGLTANQNLITLHDALGNLLATTPDQSAVWLGGGAFAASLGGSFRLAAPFCWLQVLAVGGTTPIFRSGGAAVGVNLGPNVGGAGLALRAQRVASGAISLGSFNPDTSIVTRTMIMLGLS